MFDKIKKIFKILFYPKTDKLESLKKRGLKVGRNFHMLENCVIDKSHCWHIEIGDNVTLAPGVFILAHDASTKMFLNYTKIKNTKIGNKVFIGARSILMPGVKIGDNVIVGAGSIVTTSIPNNSVFAGSPAKFICTTEDYIMKEKGKMNNLNCFGEEYTLRLNVNDEKKQKMKQVVEEQGIGFVI